MHLSEFVGRLDDRLRTADYADLDASSNGLQIGPAGDDTAVEHVAFAVDAAVATIDRAVEVGADALVVHHGLIWGGIDRIVDADYRRFAPLVRNDLALYVSHLPLDGHQALGNAAGLGDVLDLQERDPFGTLGGEFVGQRGKTATPYDADQIAVLLDRELDHGGQGVQALRFGPDEVRDVAVVTGSGVDWFDEAVDAGVDAFVTGEGKGKVYHEAREAGVNVYLAGHYATETFGVRRLQALADEWGLETTYIDHPTGL